MCRLWISIVAFSKQEPLICIFKCNSDIQAQWNSKFDDDRLISHISQNNTTSKCSEPKDNICLYLSIYGNEAKDGILHQTCCLNQTKGWLNLESY